jgi:hypothetical protein
LAVIGFRDARSETGDGLERDFVENTIRVLRQPARPPAPHPRTGECEWRTYFVVADEFARAAASFGNRPAASLACKKYGEFTSSCGICAVFPSFPDFSERWS